jgi:hypothetical protein
MENVFITIINTKFLIPYQNQLLDEEQSYYLIYATRFIVNFST